VIFDEGAKKHALKKRQPLQQMVLGKLVIYMLKTETRPPSLTMYKINSKWLTNLNIRPETLKLLQERIGKILEDTGLVNYFLNRTLIA
jgi:hypothetical protein